MVRNCLNEIVRVHKDGEDTKASVATEHELELEQWFRGVGRTILPITESAVAVLRMTICCLLHLTLKNLWLSASDLAQGLSVIGVSVTDHGAWDTA